jgi:hypothetical protein
MHKARYMNNDFTYAICAARLCKRSREPLRQQLRWDAKHNFHEHKRSKLMLNRWYARRRL